MLKKIYKYGSTLLLVVILVILLVPSWRVSFQGWFQGLWMDDIEFEIDQSTPLSSAIETWELTPLGGTSIHFNRLNDAPIILSFWATWCPSCRTELGELKSLQEFFKTKINFIAVSEESPATVQKSGLDLQYNFLYTTERFPPDFKIQVYPTLIIIDKGIIINRIAGSGEIDTGKNRDFLNRLIENR